jgi:hypothetical protein
VLAYSLVACVAAPAAFWLIFTTFAPYDDEGTLLVDLIGFVHGHMLYRDIFAQYGPLYFELFGGLFALTGKAITNDTGRMIVVCIWTVLTVMLGVIAQRLTGRLLLGVAAAAVSFRPLGGLIFEPMHPVGLSALLVGATCLLVAIGPRSRPRLAGGLLGASLAALLLTKINIGLFALAALGFAAVLTTSRLRAMRWLVVLVTAGFGLMPLVLMHTDLKQAWVRDLTFITTCSLAAVMVVAHGFDPPPRSIPGGRRWIVGGLIGFAATVIVVIGAILASGTTLGDLFDAIVVEAAKGRRIFVIPFSTRDPDTLRALVSLTGAIIGVAVLRRTGRRPGFANGSLRIAAGLVIWAFVGQMSLFPSSSFSDGLVLPMVLAWVAAVPVAAAEEDPVFRLARVFVPAIAITDVLQIYPVAGSQTSAAAIWFVPVGAICIGDGLNILSARGAAIVDAARIAVCGLAALALWAVIVRPAISEAIQYSDTPGAKLNGAGLIHIDPNQAKTYERLAALLRENCTAFVSYPSINSLYLWTGIQPPRESLPGGWMTLIDDQRQARVVKEMERAARPCEVRNDSLAGFWINGQPPPQTPLTGPLVTYLATHFRVAEQVGDYQFMVPAP